LYKHTHYGYNELHYNVLRDYKNNEKLPDFKSISATKKATSCLAITPLHFACINPDSKVLEQVLKMNGDIHILDSNMRKPIHYAAACSNPDNLKLLIARGASLQDIDTQKTTVMHCAVLAGRLENVKYILSQSKELAALKNRAGLSPWGIACQQGSSEIMKTLFETGLVKINMGIGRDKIQPLGYAVIHGNFELCEWLIANKARVIGQDKFKRTNLIMAVRNGQVRIASLLLKHGAEWDKADSSGNCPLHFAAAYGWKECIDLLLKAGCDVNVQNSWRFTPINLAMVKHHHGIVKHLLEIEDVDVNCKDDKGRTLLSFALMEINEKSVEFIKFLLEKGSDPNIIDIESQNALHYLAAT
jgi:ankyrin repeat protein